MLKKWCFCLLLAASLDLAHSAAFAGDYTYERIDVPGSLVTTPTALNASGTVIGSWRDSEFHIHGFIYAAGTITSFDFPGADLTAPTGINASGEIVGYYRTSVSGLLEGFVYENGNFTAIKFPNSKATVLEAINDDGVISGYAAPSGVQIVFTEVNGKFTALPPKNSPIPVAINSSGSIVGLYQGATIVASGAASSTGSASFLVINNKPKTIPIPDVESGQATGINNANTVVGQVTAKNGKQKSFIYKGTKLTVFDVPGWSNSSAAAINNNGSILGSVSSVHGPSAVYVYDGTSFTFLSIPNSSVNAVQINDAGQILGAYTGAPTYVTQAFLATPKPVQLATRPHGLSH